MERSGKAIADVKCTGKLTSLLEQEWFGKVVVKSDGEAFDFPD